MELKYQAVLVLVVLLVAAAFYYVYVYRTANGGTPSRYSGMAFKVDPVKTVRLPWDRNHFVHCYYGAEPMPLGTNGSRVTLHAAYAITNTGEKQTDYPPAAIYLVVANQTTDEEPLIYPYVPGQLLYNSSKEFGFNAREFVGGEFNPRSVGAFIQFNFQLVYCAGCSDPAKEGLVIYQESTTVCQPIPRGY